LSYPHYKNNIIADVTIN